MWTTGIDLHCIYFSQGAFLCRIRNSSLSIYWQWIIFSSNEGEQAGNNNHSDDRKVFLLVECTYSIIELFDQRAWGFNQLLIIFTGRVLVKSVCVLKKILQLWSGVRISVPLRCLGLKAHQQKAHQSGKGRAFCVRVSCLPRGTVQTLPGLGGKGELYQALFWHSSQSGSRLRLSWRLDQPLTVCSRWLWMHVWFGWLLLLFVSAEVPWFFQATKAKKGERVRWQKATKGQSHIPFLVLISGKSINLFSPGQEAIASLSLCLMGTRGTHTSCFRTLSFLFSISWTSDTCKVEEMCKTVEGGLSKHKQNQAEPGTLKPLCVFTLLVHEMLNWCFLLLITTHQGQHCAVYRLHILRENDTLSFW